MATMSSKRRRPAPITMGWELSGFDGVMGHLIPEGIEIEPVEGGFAQPFFQPHDETAGVAGHGGHAACARQMYLIGELVNSRAVTVAVMLTGKQIHRACQQGRHQI